MRSLAMRRKLFGFSLVLPAAFFSVLLISYPLIRTFWMSLHNYNLARPTRMYQFTGFNHYATLLQDIQFWHSLLVMLIYSAAVTVLAYTIGLCAALLLNRRTRAVQIGRMLLTLPWAVPGVVGGFVFVWMFDASYGVSNYLLNMLGTVRYRIPWLVQPDTAMFVIILAAVWKTVPLNMLTHLAALQSVPGELYEAARVDGASIVQQFRYITWPALAQVRAVTILLTTLHAFREFGQIYVISGGGPSRATETLSVQLYVEAF
ncbi:MAG: multiple sugar transport system permease protein, partial [Clostridia bacterium]|nr:multiple sugar transport system permease protein [Clostridia bacterium]